VNSSVDNIPMIRDKTKTKTKRSWQWTWTSWCHIILSDTVDMEIQCNIGDECIRYL